MLCIFCLFAEVFIPIAHPLLTPNHSCDQFLIFSSLADITGYHWHLWWLLEHCFVVLNCVDWEPFLMSPLSRNDESYIEQNECWIVSFVRGLCFERVIVDIVSITGAELAAVVQTVQLAQLSEHNFPLCLQQTFWASSAVMGLVSETCRRILDMYI